MTAQQDLSAADASITPTEALDNGIVDAPADSTALTGAADGVERLAMRIGDLHLMCAPQVGREVLLPPPVSVLPHTPPWLSGIANVRGALVPVVDLGRAFGVDHLHDRRTYLLISGSGDDALGMLVDGLPVLQHLNDGERLAGIPPHPDLLHGYVRGAYEHGGAVWLDVDVRGVFEKLGEQIVA